MRKQVILRLDEAVLGRVEADRKERGQSRQVWLERAVEKALGGVVVSELPVDDLRPDPAAESLADVSRVRSRTVVAGGRPVQREGESRVAFNIRLKDWTLKNK